MKYLFIFVKDLERIIYDTGIKLMLKRNQIDRELFRVKAGTGAVPNYYRIEIRDTTQCVFCIGPCNGNRITV